MGSAQLAQKRGIGCVGHVEAKIGDGGKSTRLGERERTKRGNKGVSDAESGKAAKHLSLCLLLAVKYHGGEQNTAR